MSRSEVIAAYCWPQSAAAGDDVTVYCHTTAATFRIEVLRQGAADEVVWQSDALPGHAQPQPERLSVDGCDWLPSAGFTVRAGWRSGFYLVRCITEDGEVGEAFVVVRAPADDRARALLASARLRSLPCATSAHIRRTRSSTPRRTRSRRSRRWTRPPSPARA